MARLSAVLAILASAASVIGAVAPNPAADLADLTARGNGHGHHADHDKPIDKRSAQEVIRALNLTQNPEKGWFKETFRDDYHISQLNKNGTLRSASTAIYYLLEGSVGDSLWHRIDATEVWHYYAGAPMQMSLSYNDGSPTRKHILGPDVFKKGQAPFLVIDAWEWQRAKSLGDWTLVGTTGEFTNYRPVGGMVTC